MNYPNLKEDEVLAKISEASLTLELKMDDGMADQIVMMFTDDAEVEGSADLMNDVCNELASAIEDETLLTLERWKDRIKARFKNGIPVNDLLAPIEANRIIGIAFCGKGDPIVLEVG